MRIDRVRLRHLRAFVTVASQGSLVKAAAAMSISQPAISKAISELEDIVDEKLFDRKRRGVKLTNAGEVLLRHAGGGLRMLSDGLEMIGHGVTVSAPTLALGALPGVGATILPKALMQYSSIQPYSRVNVRTGSNAYLLALLRQGELDFMIGRLAQPSDMVGLTFEMLYMEPLVFAVRPGHPLLQKLRLTPAMLLQFELLLPDRGTRSREPADRFFVSVGLPLPSRVIESIDPSFSRAYVSQTDTVWCAPKGVAENDFLRNSLVRLPINTNVTSGEVGLTQRADRMPSNEMHRMFVAVRAVAAERGLEIRNEPSINYSDG